MNIITKRKIQSNSYKVLIAFLFTILLAISSKISVPFYPVPMTMQTFVVLFTGVSLGARYGFIALSFYILEGALGLPVFSGTPAKGIGIAYLFGPTGGYIFGFAFSALLAGILFSNKNYFIDNKNFLITFLKVLVSSAAKTSTLASISSALKVISRAVPIGVETKYNPGDNLIDL